MASKPGAAAEFGRIVAPVAGQDGDRELIARAAGVAERFGAELSVLFTPPDPAELTPWMAEGLVGGVQARAVESLREAAEAGEAAAREAFADVDYRRASLTVLASPVWRAFACECRLSDLVVFDAPAASGGSPLSEIFQQVLMEERAAVLVLREGTDPFGPAVVAWSGDEPASRAARRATPLLRRCASVTVVRVGEANQFADPARLAGYYAARGVEAEVRAIDRADDVPAALMATAAELDAGLMVSGASGRSRLREFIFGGTTRALLGADRPSLFLAH